MKFVSSSLRPLIEKSNGATFEAIPNKILFRSVASLKTLAMKYDIQIVWFYEEPGHSRGLVDAMSSFGCKGPICQMIANEDKWFDTAQEGCS